MRMRAIVRCFKVPGRVGLKAPRRLFATDGMVEIEKSLQQIALQYHDVVASLQQIALQYHDVQKKLEAHGASKAVVIDTAPITVDVKRYDAPSVIQVTVAVQVHEGVSGDADAVKKAVATALQHVTRTKEEQQRAAEREKQQDIEESALRYEREERARQEGVMMGLDALGITSRAAFQEHCEKHPGKLPMTGDGAHYLREAIAALEAQAKKKKSK